MFSRLPYYAGIIAECATVLDAIIFVCVMKPSAFHSLCTIPLISATVDIRNTILRDCGRGSLERWGDDGGEGGGRGGSGREERKRTTGGKKGGENGGRNKRGWEWLQMQMVMKLRQMACQIDYCRQRGVIDTRRTLSSPLISDDREW